MKKKAHPRGGTCVRTDAAALIASTVKRGASNTLPVPSAEALGELHKVLAHNDSAPWGQRVPSDAAIIMLQGYGWLGKSRSALDALCAKLGRRSYGRA